MPGGGARGNAPNIAIEVSSAGVSTSMLLVICVVSGVIAAAGLMLVYYRQRLMLMAAGAGKAMCSLGCVENGRGPSSQLASVGISSETLFKRAV